MRHAIETVMEALDRMDRGEANREIADALDVPFATVRVWRRGQLPRAVRHLRSGGTLCEDCGWPAHVIEDRERYAYLLGLYLGDGCVAGNGHSASYLLRLTLDSANPAIIEEAHAAIVRISPRARASVHPHGTQACVDVTSGGSFWPCLFPQHGPGKKHERPIVLVPWQRKITEEHPGALARGLVHSDGWRGLNRVTVKGHDYAYPRYQFSNRSDDIRAIFCDACDRLGVAWRPWGRWHISVARRDSVARLDEFVGPKA